MTNRAAILVLLLVIAPVAADCLDHSPPSVSLSPTRAEGGPGYTREFVINVTSTSSCDFAPGDCRNQFSLVNYTPYGWNASLSRSDVLVVCGRSNSSASLYLTPNSAYAVSGRSYFLSVEAYDMLNPLIAGNGSAIYHVPPCSGLKCCGDRLCDTGGYPPENRTNCPSDCCPLQRNGVCEHYEDCADFDPDCCSTGDCREDDLFGCDQIKNQYAYCSLTSCSGSATGCLAPDSNCYGYRECGTGFCYNSTSGLGGGPLCQRECAPPSKYPPVVNSYDAESCCDCWDEPSKQCIPCPSLSSCFNITSDGYAIYSGKSVSINYKLTAFNCPAGKTLTLYAGGPLRRFVSFPGGEKMFRIGNATYQFSAVVSQVPAYISPGVHQLKVGAIIDNTNQGADVAEVIVTPSIIFEFGRAVPAGTNVGYVTKLAPMSYRDDIVPIPYKK